MKRKIAWLCAIAFVLLLTIESLPPKAPPFKRDIHPPIDFSSLPVYKQHQVDGGETNGLKSMIVLQKTRLGWNVIIYITPLTNFERLAWLIPTSPFNAVLALSTTNGTKLAPKDGVRAMMYLPFETTVYNVLKDLEPSIRGGQWEVVDLSTPECQTASFPLSSPFKGPFGEDLLLEVSPLMYRVHPNQQSVETMQRKVHLVEFPPIRVMLKSSGEVEKLSNAQ